MFFCKYSFVHRMQPTELSLRQISENMSEKQENIQSLKYYRQDEINDSFLCLLLVHYAPFGNGFNERKDKRGNDMIK